MHTETMIIAVLLATKHMHICNDQYSRHSKTYTSNDPLSSIAVTASEGDDDDDDDGGGTLGAAPDHHLTIRYTSPKIHRHVHTEKVRR